MGQREQPDQHRGADPEQRVGGREGLEPAAEVDEDRGQRQVADRGRPDERQQVGARGAGRHREEAERDHGHQPHAEQQRDAAGLDRALEPREARPAHEPVEQRPRRVPADPVGDQPVEQPAQHDQRQPHPEPVDVAHRRVEDLRRVPDDDVGEGEHQRDQRPADAEPAQVAAQLIRVAGDRVPDAGAQRLDRQDQDRQQDDPADRRHDARERGRLPLGRRLGPLSGGLLHRPSMATTRKSRPCAQAPSAFRHTGGLGAWRSLVARTVRVGEVPGSNPGAPISRIPPLRRDSACLRPVLEID